MRIVRPCALASYASETTSAPARRSVRRLVLMMKRRGTRGKRTESRLEADLWQLAITRLGLEELELLVAHRSGGKIRRKRGDGGVEVAHDGVVIAPRILDGVFYGSELRLEIAESAGRLKLRIGFDGDGKTA